MKRKQYVTCITVIVCVVLFFASCGSSDYDDPKRLKVYKQTQLKPEVELILRAAKTAYNVKRYDIAIPKFEEAINKGWIDGIDLYQYADCLEKEGRKKESELYFQKAFDELSEFYPDHHYLDILRSEGYIDTRDYYQP